MTFGGGEGMWQADRQARSRTRPTSWSRRRSTPAINFIDTANVYSEGQSETIPARRCRISASRATRSWSRPRCSGGWARGRTPPAPRAATSSTRSSQPEAAAARPYRSLPDPRLRSVDADRGDDRGARQPRARGHRALCRRLQLGGLADRQGGRASPSAGISRGRPRSRPITRSPAAISSARSCRCCSPKASA